MSFSVDKNTALLPPIAHVVQQFQYFKPADIPNALVMDFALSKAAWGGCFKCGREKELLLPPCLSPPCAMSGHAEVMSLQMHHHIGNVATSISHTCCTRGVVNNLFPVIVKGNTKSVMLPSSRAKGCWWVL